MQIFIKTLISVVVILICRFNMGFGHGGVKGFTDDQGIIRDF